MEVGLIRSINIDQEMQQAYLDYAMSVIVARALPDARDGLKPVHRRILYAMYDMGLRPETPYKKSARIVGEVLGKYHPHGDAAVYDAMARMAQDFSMRYMLVDGQGNFGSVDGDPPAAMRYTEARLAAPAINILGDIDKETVDFSDNFDGSLREPKVLPAALPNLLVNGATGIAVGMSTSIPPHNLGEVVDALKHMLDNWNNLDDISVEGLMRFIQGPDFPTGGVIVQDGEAEGLKAAYGTGRGRVTVQARAHVEEMERGRNRIIVTELPYMTNKSSLIERIADLVREGHLEGIADLRDESDRRGLRIVIELTRTAQPDLVLKGLYKSTSMRTTFGIIMLALVDGEPRLLSLKQALRVYLEHRLVIIKRRSEHDLARARRRAHILEGLRVALKNLDEVIDLIRKSPDAENARTRLMKRFKLSEIQSQAILDMPLRRLAALERKKIEEEYKEVSALIKSLEGLLRSSAKMRQVVAEDLLQVKEAYSDRRRTYITGASQASAGIAISSSLSTVPSQSVWVGMTVDGTIARTLDDRPPRTSGFAAPRWLLPAHTHDTLYLVSDQGEAAGVPVHALPEAENPAEGIPYWKVSALNDQDRMAAMFTLPPKENRPDGWFVFSASRHGLLKKTALTEMPGATARKFTLMRINPGDRLGWVRLTTGSDEIVLATCNGMAIRFSESEVRPMGLVVAGVAGIKLQKDDELAGMDLAARQAEIFLITTEARAKRVRLAEFPLQGRYGQGVLAWKQGRDSKLAGLAVGRPSTRLTVHLEKLAPKSFRFDEVPLQTRAASGKSILALKGGERVTGLTVALGESRHASATPPPQTPPRPPRRKPQVDGSEDGKPSPSSARVGQSKLGALTGSKSTPEKDGAGRRTSRLDAEGGLKTSPAHTAKKSPSKFAKPATTVDASSTRATKTRQSVTPGAGKTASSVQSSKPAEAKPSRPTAQPKTKTSPQTKLSTRSAKGAPLPPATRKKAAATLTERPSASTRRAPGTGAGSNPPIGKSSSPAKTSSRSPGAGLKASPSRGGTGRKSAPEAKSVKLHSTLTGSASKKSPATSAKPARGNTQVKAGDKARSGKKTSKPASGSSKSASGSSKPISGSSKTKPKGKATLVTKRSPSPAAPKAVTTKLKPAPEGKVKPSSKTPSSSAGSKPGASKPGPVATQKKGAAGKRGKPG